MTFKLLLLDIDGTTVANDPHALPSRRVIEAVHAARTRVQVAVATGRPFHLAQPVLTSLNLSGLGVFNGGSEIIDIRTRRVIHRQCLSIETIRSVVTLALPFGYSIFLHDDPYGTPIRSPEEVTNVSSQLLIEAVSKADLLALLEQLSHVHGAARQYDFRHTLNRPVSYATGSWKNKSVVDIHIVHEQGTKRYGVERLARLSGTTKAETIAIGDSENDIPMLEASGFKVAMASAPGEVKGIADYIAPSLEEDGVAVIIDKFILSAPLEHSQRKAHPTV